MVFYVISSQTYGQNALIINPDPSHFLINKGQILPSSYKIDRSLISAIYQNKTGIFSDIRNLYADAVIKTPRSHTFGLKLYSEQETSLFSKSKLFFLYGYTVQLSERIFWTSAAQIGGTNINFDASAASGGGSGWNWDASISSTLQLNTWEAGISLHQIPASRIRPINYEFQLTRYIDSYLSKNFSVDSTYFWETGVRMRTTFEESTYYFDNKISYRNLIGALIMINTDRRASVGTFFSIPNSSNSWRAIQVSFNYSFSFNTPENLGLYNIGLYIFR